MLKQFHAQTGYSHALVGWQDVICFHACCCAHSHSSEYLEPQFLKSGLNGCNSTFGQVHVMTDYGEYLQPTRGLSLVRPATDDIHHSLTRNSYYYDPNTSSVSASTRSWVYSTQQYPPDSPPLPPPLPIPLPTPVQRLRPLPNPHAQQHRAAVLHPVNPSQPLYHEGDHGYMDTLANTPDATHFRKVKSNKVYNPGPSIPSYVNDPKDKKRTVMGGFVKSIRRIPNIMFGYGTGTGTARKLRRRGTLGTNGEGTPITVTGLGLASHSGNTLPQYASNPPTPAVGSMPPNVHYYTHQPTGMQMQTTAPVERSPPPEVVRLDDVRRHRQSFRIMPPSVNVARSETAHFFPGPNATTRSSQYTDNPTDCSSSTAAANTANTANTADRTTVMLYHHDTYAPTPTTPTPPLPISRQISSNGPPGRLSYIGSEQIVRPTSFHGGSQAPPPLEIPTSIPRMATPSSHLSYVSQVAAVPSTLPLQIRRSPSQRRSQLSNQSHPPSQSHSETQSQPRQPQPQQQPQSTTPQRQLTPPPPIIELSQPIQSPVSAHPQPTADYLKMASSPPHSFQYPAALSNPACSSNPSSSRVTSFSHDPSFSGSLNIIERFFKTLYNMPWVAYERITVDYFPRKIARRVHGHTLGREKNSKGGKEEKGDRRRREAMDTRERAREREKERERERRRRKERERDHGDYGKRASWYKAVLSRSRRTSTQLDLLNSDLGSNSSPITPTSLGAAIGLELKNLPVDAASPRLAAASAAAATMKSAEQERRKNMGDKHERTSRSHHHRQDPPRGRQKRKSPGDLDANQDKGNEDQNSNRPHSPLIPTVYPFHYPPYPYTYPYPAFTMPAAGPPPIISPHAQSQSQSQRHRPPPSQNPPTSGANNKQGQKISQPLLYNPGIPHPQYAAAAHAYQPMMAPQVYLLHSTSRGQLQAQAQMQPLSSSGRVENTGEVAGGGEPVGGTGTGDSGQQPVLDQ